MKLFASPTPIHRDIGVGQPAIRRPLDREPRTSLTPLDWLLIALLSAFLVTLCILRSRTRLLWADELYGFRVLASPALGAMLRGWREGADGGGLVFYLLARLWTDLFGLTELSLRLFSTAGMCVALALTWAAARRYFALVPTAWAVSIVYLTPAVMLWQELNGRFYGLFLASACLAALCFLLANDQSTHLPTPRLLLLTAAAHACLLGSHILGMVFSFSLIAGNLFFDLLNHRLRGRLLLAQLAGWLLLPLSLHAIRASSSIATTTFWTHHPSARELLPALAVFGKLTQWLLLAALLAALMAAPVAALTTSLLRRKQPGAKPLLPRAPLVLVAALVLAQFILFAKSLHGISIYADRYLLPLSVATVLLFAAAFQRLLPAGWLSSRSPLLTPVLIASVLLPCMGFAASRDTNFALYPSPGYPARIAALIPPGAPVLATNPTFNLLSHYDPNHTYLFMTDWPYDLQPARAGIDFSGERLMENWQRAGYEPDHILPCPVLFARYSDLYVLLTWHHGDWFHDRLLHNPNFQVRHLAYDPAYWPLDLWSVHRLTPGPPPC